MTPRHSGRLARVFRHELELLEDIRLWLRHFRRCKQLPPDVVIGVKSHQLRFEHACLLDGAPPAATLAFAESIVDRVAEIRLFSARKLLSLYNDHWRNDREPVITVEEFAQRLVDPQITIADENSASVTFDPSGMFGEHYISVWIDHGQFVDASMEG